MGLLGVPQLLAWAQFDLQDWAQLPLDPADPETVPTWEITIAGSKRPNFSETGLSSGCFFVRHKKKVAHIFPLFLSSLKNYLIMREWIVLETYCFMISAIEPHGLDHYRVTKPKTTLTVHTSVFFLFFEWNLNFLLSMQCPWNIIHAQLQSILLLKLCFSPPSMNTAYRKDLKTLGCYRQIIISLY